MPLFQSTYEKLGDDGLVILAVDVSEPADKVQAYVNQMKLTFPVALDSDGKVSSLFRVRGLPTSFFIDVGGVIVDMNRGGVTQATLAPRLSLLGLGQAAEGG
jgi:peroxiredoxin